MAEKVNNYNYQKPHVYMVDMRFFQYISNASGKEEVTDPAYVGSIWGDLYYRAEVKLFFWQNVTDIVFDFVQYIL